MNPGSGVDVVQGAAAGVDGGVGDMKWAVAVDLWAKWMRTARYSTRTIELRRYQISHLGDEILSRSPWRIKTADLIEWMAEQEWEPETQKSWNAALRSFYTWAVTNGYTKRNPAENLPPVRVADGVPKPAPASVIEAAFERTTTDCQRLILGLMAYAGLRRAEVASLKWDQINDGAIRMKGKGKRIRYIPLDEELAAALDDEYQRRQAGSKGSGFRYTTGLAAGYVFGGRNGSHMSPNTIGRIARDLLGGQWTGHTLRHSFLTLALSGTSDLAAVQDLAGHSSPKTTRGYTLVDTSRTRAAVAAVRRPPERTTS